MKSISEPLNCILQQDLRDQSATTSTPHTTLGFFLIQHLKKYKSYDHMQDTHDIMVNVHVISSTKYLIVFGEVLVLFNLLVGVSSWNVQVYVGSQEY
jgi:hypothetical protein